MYNSSALRPYATVITSIISYPQRICQTLVRSVLPPELLASPPAEKIISSEHEGQGLNEASLLKPCPIQRYIHANQKRFHYSHTNGPML